MSGFSKAFSTLLRKFRDEPQAARSKLKYSSNICHVCATINAVAIFRISDYNTRMLSAFSRTLGTYNEIVKRRECRFCQLVAISLQQYAPLILEQNSNGIDFLIRLCVLREEKPRIQPIVRLRMIYSNGFEVDVLRVNPGGQVGFSPELLGISTRGIGLINLESINIERIKFWIQGCQRGHERCMRIKCQVIPLPGFHLIDTVDNKIVDATLDMDYIALSYVWGVGPGLKAHQFQQTLSTDLPQTIQDAIDVTRAIGMRFIWIDAFCIPQDESEIKFQQIGQMDKIYRSAVAVIVAATGDSAGHGLRGLTRSKQVTQSTTYLNGVCVTCTPAEPGLPAQPRLSRWSTRGWTLQEGILAQRRIIFTDDEIILDCGVTCLRETESAIIEQEHGYLSELQRPQVGKENTMRLWERLLSRYICRNLTYQEDVLDAFQGISNYLAEAAGTKCCWTLLRQHFLNSISWYPADKSETPLRRNTLLRDGRRLPSWLWAAWKFQRIDFDNGFQAFDDF